MKFKVSQSPSSSKNFSESCEGLAIDETYIVAPVDEPYPIATKTTVMNILQFLKIFKNEEE